MYFLPRNIYSKDIEYEYVKAVKKELRLIKEKGKCINASVGSLYIGGGTLTAISSESLKELIIAIKEEFDCSEISQICVESNPVLTTKEILLELKQVGVNRISLGLQSCNNAYLQMFNCFHRFEDFIKAFKLLKELEFKIVNVDLMYRLPEQALKDWIDTITKVINMSPEHISIYSLGIIKGTKLYADLNNNILPDVPNVAEELEMRKIVKDLLYQNGYYMNRLDEFSKEGYENLYSSISRLGQTIALGAGATGVYNNILYQNLVDVNKYIHFIKENKLPVKNGIKLTGKEKISRYMVLMPYYLGFNTKEFEYLFGVSAEQIYSESLNKMIDYGYLTISKDCYRLTDLGEVFASKVSQEFYNQDQKDVINRYIDFVS